MGEIDESKDFIEQKMTKSLQNNPKYEFTIKDMVFKMTNWKETQKVTTDEFMALGNKFFLTIYPNKDGKIQVFITNTSEHEVIISYD